MRPDVSLSSTSLTDALRFGLFGSRSGYSVLPRVTILAFHLEWDPATGVMGTNLGFVADVDDYDKGCLGGGEKYEVDLHSTCLEGSAASTAASSAPEVRLRFLEAVFIRQCRDRYETKQTYIRRAWKGSLLQLRRLFVCVFSRLCL